MDDFEFVAATIEPWLAKYFAHGLSGLTELEAFAVGVWLLDAQVNNGGFDQYYFNTGGKLPLPEDHDGRMKALDAVANARGFSAYDTE